MDDLALDPTTTQLFPLGQILTTPGALDALERAMLTAIALLKRYVRLEPGELTVEEQAINHASLEAGGPVCSVFRLSDDTRLWITTSGDRSSPMLFLPGELGDALFLVGTTGRADLIWAERQAQRQAQHRSW